MIEGNNAAGRALALALWADGEHVVDLPVKLTHRVRMLDTGHGRKIDAQDAPRPRRRSQPPPDPAPRPALAGPALRALLPHLRQLAALRHPPPPPQARPHPRLLQGQGPPPRDPRLRRPPRPGLPQVVRQDLADHRADRRAWVRDLLGLPDDPDADNYIWVQAAPTDPDVLPRENRLLLAIADRSRWREQLQRAHEEARGLTTPPCFGSSICGLTRPPTQGGRPCPRTSETC